MKHLTTDQMNFVLHLIEEERFEAKEKKMWARYQFITRLLEDMTGRSYHPDHKSSANKINAKLRAAQSNS